MKKLRLLLILFLLFLVSCKTNNESYSKKPNLIGEITSYEQYSEIVIECYKLNYILCQYKKLSEYFHKYRFLKKVLDDYNIENGRVDELINNPDIQLLINKYNYNSYTIFKVNEVIDIKQLDQDEIQRDLKMIELIENK